MTNPISTIGDLLTLGATLQTGPFGTVLKASEYSEEGAPVISVGEIADGVLRLRADTRRVPPSVTERLPHYVLRTGDIVFARKGAVERTAMVQADEDGYFLGSDGIRLRVDDSALARYVALSLRSPETKQWLTRHAGGSTLASMNERIIASTPVRLPERAEQRAVAELLGALDEKVAANHRLATRALALASTLFEAQPTPTRQDRYDDVALIGGGGTPSTKNEAFWNGTIPWVTPTDVTALTLPYLVGTSRRITDAGLAACSSALYPANSILMTSRATIGAFAIAKVPVAVNQGFIVVRPKDERYFMWLFHEMQNRVAEYLSHANGATFLELSRGRFKDLPVHWPSIESASQFSAHVTPLHDRAVQVSQENTRLETLRDTLLPHLMSGRLSIRQATATVEEVL